MNDAEQNVKIAKAQLSEKIRNDPEKYKLKKPTDKSVALVVDMSDEKAEAKRKYHKAIKNFRVLEDAKKAFSFQKKMALEKIAEFSLAGFHTEPRLKGKVKVYVEEKSSINMKEDLDRHRKQEKKSKRKLII